MSKKPKFYVVWKGRQTGVFTSWEATATQVSGYPNAEYKGFETREAAEAAWRGQYADYKGRHVSSLSQARLLEIGAPIVESYAVDAACSGNPGILEYRGVNTRTRAELFKQGPFAEGTNNIGEFLAIVHALALLTSRDSALPVYSDSENAIAWVRAGRCKTRLAPGATNRPLFELIGRAEDWLSQNDYPNKILKWETEAWGENPADFGRK